MWALGFNEKITTRTDETLQKSDHVFLLPSLLKQTAAYVTLLKKLFSRAPLLGEEFI